MIAGIRSGKTLGGAYDSGLMAAELGGAKNIGVIIEPTYSMCRDIAESAFLDMWAPLVKDHNKNERSITLMSNHKVLFRSATDPEMIRGLAKVAWVWMDEVGMMKNGSEVWKIVRGRLADLLAPVLITTTPKFTSDTLWLKQLYDMGLDPATSGDGVAWKKRYYTLQMSSRDNPYLDADEWDEIQKAYSGDFYLQEVEGHFIDAALLFKASWIQRWTPNQLDGLRLAHFMNVDFCATEEERADRDEHAITVYGVAPGGKVFVREIWSGQVGFNAVYEKIFAMAKQYNVNAIGMEQVAFQKVVIKRIRELMDERNIFIPIIPIMRGKTNKVLRAQPAAAAMERGMLLFPDVEMTNKVVAQLLAFPFGKDDIVDTLADIYNPQMRVFEGAYDFAAVRPETSDVDIPIMTQDEIDEVLAPGNSETYW
jgi:predicted phage terminase large subunit-like protein